MGVLVPLLTALVVTSLAVTVQVPELPNQKGLVPVPREGYGPVYQRGIGWQISGGVSRGDVHRVGAGGSNVPERIAGIDSEVEGSAK